MRRVRAYAQEDGPSLWQRINPFSDYNVRKWAEETGIGSHTDSNIQFTEDELSLIFFLGSGGGAAPGRYNIRGSGGTTSSAGRFQLRYDPRVWQRAADDPLFHNFPVLIDKMVLSTKPTVFGGGYRLYRLQGSRFGNKNLYEGYFEIGVHPSGVIDHRMFRPFTPK